MLKKSFLDLGLSRVLLKAVERQGYTVPTDVQTRSIPELLLGRDILGTAQTGTGKTAAFVLPLLDLLMKERTEAGEQEQQAAGERGGGTGRRVKGAAVVARPRGLILAPTRELAIQIDESVVNYGYGSGIRHAVVYGGAPKPTQAARLRALPEILTATPGRLMDFIGERIVDLSDVRILVLDEADRMLDMGFIPVVRQIAAMTSGRKQTVLFSATMPREIELLARELLTEPARISIAPREVTVPLIRQSVLHLGREDKLKLLPALIRDRNMFRVLVFTRTKHRASRLARILDKADISSDAIHGDRTQNQRQRALERFRDGKIQVLVATDVASRGIDVDDITHVINFEIPHEPESYVHRIGRTGRAGNGGDAISLCDAEELADFRAIEKLIGFSIPIDREHPYHTEPVKPAKPRTTFSGRGGLAPQRGAAAWAGKKEKEKRRSENPYRNGGETKKDGSFRSYGRERT